MEWCCDSARSSEHESLHLGEFWAGVVAIASVVSAVVGFVVRTLTVRKSALEIEKLNIEIAQKRRDDSPIQIATFEQIERFRVDECRQTGGRDFRYTVAPRLPLFKALLVFFLACVGGYLLFGYIAGLPPFVR
jgi:hypothetical protein